MTGFASVYMYPRGEYWGNKYAYQVSAEQWTPAHGQLALALSSWPLCTHERKRRRRRRNKGGTLCSCPSLRTSKTMCSISRRSPSSSSSCSVAWRRLAMLLPMLAALRMGSRWVMPALSWYVGAPGLPAAPVVCTNVSLGLRRGVLPAGLSVSLHGCPDLCHTHQQRWH